MTLPRRRWVRWTEAALGTALGAALAGACAAQSSEPRNLTIWIVRPATAADRAVQRAQNDLHDISQYRETTAGSFGKSASDVGQTAGSYGKSPSEVGKNASDVGQTAGSYGQSASSLPSNVPSQTAGSYGMTAGSFGTAASDYNGAPKAGSAVDDTASRDSKGSRWTTFLSSLKDGLKLQVRVLEVPGLELRGRLTGAARTAAFPDVLISDRMPEWWPAVRQRTAVRRLGQGSGLVEAVLAFPGESQLSEHRGIENPYVEADGLVDAPHPEATREFLEWWYARQEFSASAGKQREDPSPAETAARGAVLAVLNGRGVESVADPSLAGFDPEMTRARALGLEPEEIPPDSRVDAAVLSSQANRRLAVVSLHAVVVSRKGYGELFPLVMLRADEHGQWRVLQISLQMSSPDVSTALRTLQPYDAPREKEAAVGTPMPAFPENGDQRTAHNGLRVAWDESADDGLLVVEWQRKIGGARPASAVMLVSDIDGRARTEVGAPFADVTGAIRWRVWALGRGGVVRLSDWRTVEMAR